MVVKASDSDELHRLPELDDHRLPRRQEPEPRRDRDPAVRLPVVLAPGEQRRVLLEELDRLRQLLMQLDLAHHGIGAEVDEPPGGHVLRQRRGSAVEVEQQRRGLIERFHLQLGQPVVAAVGMPRVERPAVAEVEPAHHGVDERRREDRPVVVGAHEHLRRRAVRLDVVRLVAEPLQPDQVLHGQPDHAGDGVPARHPEHDDLLSDAHAVASPGPDTSDSASFFLRCRVCTSCICLYKPPRAISSSWVPCSTSPPRSSVAMRSA